MLTPINETEWKEMVEISKHYNAIDLFQPPANFPCYDIQIQACLTDEDGNCEAGVNEEEADMFSIYVHTIDKDYAVKNGPTCWFADFKVIEDAEKAAEIIAEKLGVEVANLIF